MNKLNILALALKPAMYVTRSHLGGAIIVVGLALGLTASAIAQGPIVEVVGGLHSPRGLAIDSGGLKLFVAQTGDDTVNGSIIEISRPMSANPPVRTIISGLPNVGDPEDGEFLGISGIAMFGHGPNFGLYGIMAVDPQQTGDLAFGNLIKVNSHGQLQSLANVGSFDYEWTAQHVDLAPNDFPDANPYGVLVLPGHLYVVDAGANTLDEVMPDGSIRILAYFPLNPLADATPTCACKGPDGFLYVGTLALVDSLVNGPSAKVYRLDPSQANLAEPWNTPMTVWASGLWPINGCTFGRDGNFYASQLLTNPNFVPPNGDVVKIPFNSPGTHTFLAGGALSFTGGVAVARNGAVYVADGTAFVPPGEGRIVRIGP